MMNIHCLAVSMLFLFVIRCVFVSIGKKINRVACGSAHSLAWSTNKPSTAGHLPAQIPMEYNHLQVYYNLCDTSVDCIKLFVF